MLQGIRLNTNFTYRLPTLSNLKDKIEKSTKAIETAARDQLLFGVSVMEKNEDGSLTRIDPFSEEGQEAIKKHNEESK